MPSNYSDFYSPIPPSKVSKPQVLETDRFPKPHTETSSSVTKGPI